MNWPKNAQAAGMRGLSLFSCLAASIVEPDLPKASKKPSSISRPGRLGNILPYLLSSASASESFRRGAMIQLCVLTVGSLSRKSRSIGNGHDKLAPTYIYIYNCTKCFDRTQGESGH